MSTHEHAPFTATYNVTFPLLPLWWPSCPAYVHAEAKPYIYNTKKIKMFPQIRVLPCGTISGKSTLLPQQHQEGKMN